MNYLIIFLIIIIIFILSKYINISKIEREKLTAYECGFQEFIEETSEIKKRYYLKYYIIAIIFLIFDLEILLLYPFVTSFSHFLYQATASFADDNFFYKTLSTSIALPYDGKSPSSTGETMAHILTNITEEQVNTYIVYDNVLSKNITISYIIIIFFILLLFLGLIFETNKFIII